MNAAQAETADVTTWATTHFARVWIYELAAVTDANLELAPCFTGDH